MKGLATHTGLELCAVPREGRREALTKGCMGQVLSREMTSVLGADPVKGWGRLHPLVRQGESKRDLTRSETLCTCTNDPRENREIPWPSEACIVSDRIGESKDIRR